MLHCAVEHGNHQLLTRQLGAGANVNAVDADGNTALHVAALSKIEFNIMEPIITALLTCEGIQINATNKENQTPLHLAFGRHDDMAKLLIRAGADIEAQDNQRNCPIHYAVIHGNLDGFTLLVKSGANVKVQNVFGHNQLMHFVHEKLLLNLDTLNEESMKIKVLTLLELLEKLVHLNLSSNQLSRVNLTPISMLLDARHAKGFKIQFLHRMLNDCNKNSPDVLGFCPIHYVVLQGNIEILDLLLQLGCDVNARDSWGRTSLHLVLLSCNIIEGNHVENTRVRNVPPKQLTCLEAFIQHKASIHIPDKSGRLPLHYAVEYGLVEFVELLLSYEDSSSAVDVADKTGIVPLHIAAARNHCSAITMLIKQGADINLVDNHGSSAFHFASFTGATDAVELLLMHNADVSTKDVKGNTPLDIAKYRHFKKCERLLLEHCHQCPNLSDELQLTGHTISADCVQSVRMIREVHPDNVSFKTCLSSQNVKEIEGAIQATLEGHCVIEDRFPHLPLLSHPLPFEDILSEMYKVPGVGLVTTDLPEVSDIASAITVYLEKVCTFVTSLDARFRCTLIPSGSFFEKTKVGDPDEFDFMVQLDYFSGLHLMHSGTDMLIDKKDVKEIKNFVDLSRDPPVLDSCHVVEHFQQLFVQALGLALDYLHTNLQLLAPRDILYTIIMKQSFTKKRSYVLECIWNGTHYKNLHIDIDIVAVFGFKGQYLTRQQMPYIKAFWDDPPFIDNGLSKFLSPSQDVTGNAIGFPTIDRPDSGYHLLPHDIKSSGRVSFSLKEGSILSQWPEPVRRAYVYAKMLRHKCFIPSCYFDKFQTSFSCTGSYTPDQFISAYALKTLLLHTVKNPKTVGQSSLYYLKTLYQELEASAKGKQIKSYFIPGRDVHFCKGTGTFEERAYCVFICECVAKYFEKPDIK